MTRWRFKQCLVAAACLLIIPAGAWAQATSGTIAGVVRDTSAGVMPGVTVEAASPALIEKVRSVVTDSAGQYRIVDLRPGTYSVTFTLPGFKVVRREGIELTTGFTANVDAEMTVGELEETITVTGASPVVDTQNSRTQVVLPTRVLESVPIGRTEVALAALTLGVFSNQQDTGGSKGEQPTTMTVHGSPGGDTQATLDGMHFGSLAGGANIGSHWYKVNQIGIQETTLSTSASTAETPSGGVIINYVPKDGGNLFRSSSSLSYVDDTFQSSNLSDELKARGLLISPAIKRIHDYGTGVGGPLMRDKLWFFTAHRAWGAQEYVPSTYYNKNQGWPTRGSPLYEADLSRPGFKDLPNRDHTGRVTWQATSRQKFAFSESYQDNCFCTWNLTGALTPESSNTILYDPILLTQGTWSYVRERFLVSAGITSAYNQKVNSFPEGVTAETIPITDTGLGLTYNAPNFGLGATSIGEKGYSSTQANGHFTVSRVTGSHNFRTGFQFQTGADRKGATMPSNVTYTFRLGVPVSVTQWATPHLISNSIFSWSLWAQDQWTANRLTLNLGLRMDAFRGWAGAINLPAGPFLPARVFPRIDDIPNFKDLSPRLGATYDLFGTDKTAVKVALGKYVQNLGSGFTEQNNPLNALSTNATRTWNDSFYPAGDPRRGNYRTDCDLTNFSANGECGTLDNSRFGSAVPTRRFDPEVLEGFGVRTHTWQGSVAIQQELRPGMGLTAGYFRTWYGNFTATDNRAVTPADYDPFCVTAPADSRLPNGGNYEICGLYDLKRERFGAVDNVVVLAERFGDRTQVFDGVDVSVDLRLQNGGFFSGGMSTGRTVTDSCFVVDSPQELLHCRISDPLMAGTQFKANAIYPLPFWGLQASVIWQNLPAGVNDATRAFANAAIAPSLGRNLASCPTAQGACASAVNVPLYRPRSRYEDARSVQTDLRLTKNLAFGRTRARLNLDIFNLFNGNAVLSASSAYGPNWLRPALVAGPRLFSWSVQVDY